MKSYKAGALFYVLWGIVHIAGGVSLLTAWASGGGGELVRMLGSALPATDSAIEVPEVASAVMAFHAFNLAWIGLLVLLVAVTLNWKNSRLGFWINLALVGFADLGLTLFLLAPGYTAWTEGMIGISLFVLALAFSTYGIARPRGAGPEPEVAG